MSFGSNDLFSLKAPHHHQKLRSLLFSDLLVVFLSCSLLLFVSFFSSSRSLLRMRRWVQGSTTDSMRLKSTRPGFGVKYFGFGFLHIDRCFFLFIFLRCPFT